MWQHHCHPGPSKTLEIRDSFHRWSGPGNTEFRRNLSQALADGSALRLVLTRTMDSRDVSRIEAGDDAGKILKDYFLRDDLIGEVVSIVGEEYLLRFRKH